MKKGTVLIFGGSGFLGSYVVDECLSRGYQVVNADMRTSEYTNPDDAYRFVQSDIMDKDAIQKLVSSIQPHTIYNFAGFANLDLARHAPLDVCNLNIIGNLHILEAANANNVQRFIYASSAYAQSKKGSFYGVSKFASEKLIEENFSQNGLPFSIIRYGSLYGKRADESNGIYRLLRQALDTKKIIHKGSGDEMREYIHAHDAARLSVDILEDEKFRNEHIMLTGSERYSQKELLNMIQEIMNHEIRIESSSERADGHYLVTPYSFSPTVGIKLTANPFIDMGQGIVDCLNHMHSEK